MFSVFVQLSQGKAAFNWPQESLITWKGRSDQAVLQAQGKEKPHTRPSCAGNWEFETVPSRSLEPGAQKERQTLAWPTMHSLKCPPYCHLVAMDDISWGMYFQPLVCKMLLGKRTNIYYYFLEIYNAH